MSKSEPGEERKGLGRISMGSVWKQVKNVMVCSGKHFPLAEHTGHVLERSVFQNKGVNQIPKVREIY